MWESYLFGWLNLNQEAWYCETPLQFIFIYFILSCILHRYKCFIFLLSKNYISFVSYFHSFFQLNRMQLRNGWTKCSWPMVFEWRFLIIKLSQKYCDGNLHLVLAIQFFLLHISCIFQMDRYFKLSFSFFLENEMVLVLFSISLQSHPLPHHSWTSGELNFKG